MKIFLCYCHADKKQVERLHEELVSQEYTVFFDKESILHGESITGKINTALEDSDVVIVCLSNKSIESKWIKEEFQAAFFKYVNKGGVRIIPLLLEDCKVPTLLQDKKKADFRNRDKYGESLADLLTSLRKYELEINKGTEPDSTAESVFEYTKELLEELEDEYICFPTHKGIPIVKSLRQIPRSGKKVRLGNIKEKIKARSIYDHVLSVAHLADCLLPHVQHGLSDYPQIELARLIAFHDLNEIILGDIPTYTNLTRSKRKTIRAYAERNLRSVAPAKREHIANELIWLFLSEKQRQSMEKASEHLLNEKAPLTRFFNMLDNIDPIVAIWRYLNHYRDNLGDNARCFLREMKDFFENPDVHSYLVRNMPQTRVPRLVQFLQNRAKARKYYNDPEMFTSEDTIAGFPSEMVVDMIEGCPLFVS